MEKKMFTLEAVDQLAINRVQKHLKQQAPHNRPSASAAVRYAVRLVADQIANRNETVSSRG